MHQCATLKELDYLCSLCRVHVFHHANSSDTDLSQNAKLLKKTVRIDKEGKKWPPTVKPLLFWG